MFTRLWQVWPQNNPDMKPACTILVYMCLWFSVLASPIIDAARTEVGVQEMRLEEGVLRALHVLTSN